MIFSPDKTPTPPDESPPSDRILKRMMALHPKLIDLSLARVWKLLERLEHPERRLPPVIHIGGTNAKGSTLSMLRAGLEATGARVHTYSSPHLVRFHERIALEGTPIDEAFLSDILSACEKANNHEEITYFEITTVAALLAFSQRPADYCLLEVGLGGRLDATNVIAEPALSIITPISLDHQSYLGETIEKIASEKAGIIKPNRPCIVGKQDPRAHAVIEEKAEKMGAPLYRYGREWKVAPLDDGLTYCDEHGALTLPKPALLGTHQKENAGMALAALGLLGKRQASARALLDAKWPARMQKIENCAANKLAPMSEIWLDGGHNPAAGGAIANALSDLPEKALVVIVGMLNTKDNQAFLAPLCARAHTILTLEIPAQPASLSANALADIARRLHGDVRETPTIETALKKAGEIAPQGRVLITGSLYLAGYILGRFSAK